MAKVKKTKKRKWRLKKQVRKTLGCLFMISALIVTAIPVQPMEAAPGGPAGWVEEIDPPNNDWSQSNNWVYSNTTTIIRETSVLYMWTEAGIILVRI